MSDLTPESSRSPATGIADLPPPPSPNGKEVLVPPSREAWRKWLATNGDRPDGLWVVYRKKRSTLTGPLYEDLVEESLCFGWIDSLTRRVDDDRMIQWFSPRRPGGIWSAANKERIARLQSQGMIAAPGMAAIEKAKEDGSWSQTDDVDALIVPPDLAAAFAAAPGAHRGYLALPDSVKRQHLWWIHSAKRPSTRVDRITKLIGMLGGEGSTE
jgi:uncharacterized protein YdeI (YjbR/CyaY-like superfamily)